MSDLLRHLQRAEVSLHQVGVRRDKKKVEALLDESFREFGRSGVSYDRSETIDLLRSESVAGSVVSQDFELTRLGEDAALLTYKSVIVNDKQIHRYSLRASVWIYTPDGWKLLFHQGTPTSAFDVTGQ